MKKILLFLTMTVCSISCFSVTTLAGVAEPEGKYLEYSDEDYEGVTYLALTWEFDPGDTFAFSDKVRTCRSRHCGSSSFARRNRRHLSSCKSRLTHPVNQATNLQKHPISWGVFKFT
jgi:hypothetical protein